MVLPKKAIGLRPDQTLEHYEKLVKCQKIHFLDRFQQLLFDPAEKIKIIYYPPPEKNSYQCHPNLEADL